MSHVLVLLRVGRQKNVVYLLHFGLHFSHVIVIESLYIILLKYEMDKKLQVSTFYHLIHKAIEDWGNQEVFR